MTNEQREKQLREAYNSGKLEAKRIEDWNNLMEFGTKHISEKPSFESWYHMWQMWQPVEYHQQDSEVTKVDLEDLRKEFYDKCTNQRYRDKFENPDNAGALKIDMSPHNVFDFFKPHITSQKSEWISVDDRLPEGEGFVNCIVFCNGKVKEAMFNTLTKCFQETNFNAIFGVKAWQPLPQPPTIQTTNQQIK